MLRQLSIADAPAPGYSVPMRPRIVFFFLLAAIASGCRSKPTDSQNGVTANVEILNAPGGTMSGKLYLRNGHMRVDFGSMADVYDIGEKKGWRIFPDSKRYTKIGAKDVSTYAPEMTDGSPCAHAIQPAACKKIGSELIQGRPTTKWGALNQHGAQIYLWTDNQLGIAVRWQIESVSYQATGIRKSTDLSAALFQLPPGYTEMPARLSVPSGSN